MNALTYRSCGVLSVEGTPHRVRVHDVASARRVVSERSGDHIRDSHVAYFLSDEFAYSAGVPG